MFALIRYTELPKLWRHFQLIANISITSEMGFLSLSGAEAYLSGLDLSVVGVTHSQFWEIMTYFLNIKNECIGARIKLRNKQNGGKK